MNCLRCNTPNEEGAKFCKNCGMDLTYVPLAAPAKDTTVNQSVLYLLIILAWEYFAWLIMFLVEKLIAPGLRKEGEWEKVSEIYKTGWMVNDIVTMLLLITFSIIIKNNMARVFLIIFTILRVVFFLSYRVFTENSY